MKATKSLRPLQTRALCLALWVQALLLPALILSARGEDLNDTNRPAPYTLFHPVPAAQLRDWHTDFAGVSPYTTDAGHFEALVFPVAYAYFHMNLSGGRTYRGDAWAYGNTLLKAGLLNRLDLEFGILPYEQVTSTQADTRYTVSGFGDITSRLKLNVWGNDGGPTALSVSGIVKFPTAASGLGNKQFEGGPALEFAAWLPYEFELRLDSAVDLFEALGRQASFENLLSLSHQLAGPVRGFVGYNTLVYTTATDWTSQLRIGLIYRLTANLEAEAGIGFGLNGGFADYSPNLGLAARF